jgi:hypothetical protein
MKKTYQMETVSEAVAKALPKPEDLRFDGDCDGRVRYTLVRSYPVIDIPIEGANEQEDIYLGAYLDTCHPRIWAEELGSWEMPNGWGPFHLIGSKVDYFDISYMPAFAYLGFFGRTYDSHVCMTEIARKIACELDVQP